MARNEVRTPSLDLDQLLAGLDTLTGSELQRIYRYVRAKSGQVALGRHDAEVALAALARLDAAEQEALITYLCMFLGAAGEPPTKGLCAAWPPAAGRN